MLGCGKGSTVRAKNKKHVQQVKSNKHAAGPEADVFELYVVMLKGPKESKVKDRRHYQRGHGDHERSAVHGGGGAGKALHRIAKAAGNQAEAQDQQQVADDAAGKGSLDHVDVPGSEREKSNDHFGEVAHGRAQNAAGGGTALRSQVAGGFTMR